MRILEKQIYPEKKSLIFHFFFPRLVDTYNVLNPNTMMERCIEEGCFLGFWNFSRLVQGLGIWRESHIIWNMLEEEMFVKLDCEVAYCCLVAKPCPAFCNSVDCSPSGFSVRAISQARILERVAVPSCSGSSPPRDRTCISWTAGGFFTTEPPGRPLKWYVTMDRRINNGNEETVNNSEEWRLTNPGVKKRCRGRTSPGSPVVKNVPWRAGNAGSIPGNFDPACWGATKPKYHNYWSPRTL